MVDNITSSPATQQPVLQSQTNNTSSPISEPVDMSPALEALDKEKDALHNNSSTEESMEQRIERLGRERPPAFTSAWSEIAFLFSIMMSQIITEFFVSGFNMILPTLINELGIPQASSVWPATAFSLVIASTLLVFGRLGDMWGGYPVFLYGIAWMVVWSIIAGFSINPLMLNFCRALQGLGAAAYLPTGVMLMGSVYRPGPRKNLVFACYGTCAVIGFFIGIFAGGAVGQYLRWGWYFWIGALLAALTLTTSIFAVPNDRKQRQSNGISMDWFGFATIVPGLVLVVFAITESAHASDGWRTPYIPTLFSIGILFLLAAAYVECRVATQPLLPPDIFATKAVTGLVIASLLLYGNAGIFLLYGTQYFQNILGASPLLVVAWFTPMAIGGLILSTVEGFILHLVPGRALLIISGLGALGSQLLLALLPENPNYWAWIFPSMIMGTIGIDLSINLVAVFLTTQLPRARQGLAGGLVNSILQLGVAICLGFCDVVQSYTSEQVGLAASYKNTFWFGVAAGGASLIIMAVWCNIPRAKSDLTADEKQELVREASRVAQ